MEQKNIKGFEDYQITDDGRVWSKKRNKWMTIGHNQKGYCLVYLFKNGKDYTKQVHRLVAEAFIPNPNNLPQVNHKDENKENNFVFINEDGSVDLEKSNLEWCDANYNSNYGTRNKRVGEKLSILFKGKKPSEQCRQAQIKKCSKKVIQLDKLGSIITVHNSIIEAAKSIGHIESRAEISKCCRGVNKTCRGYCWKYANDTDS